MTSQSNTFSLKFADAINSFITNPDKYVDGSEKRICNIYIYKKAGIITAKSATNKVIMSIAELPDGELDVQMKFINNTIFKRLMAVKEMLKWNDINLEHSAGILYLHSNSGKRITLSSHKLYSKAELDALTNNEDNDI
jgi:hypothetical protein